MNSYTGTFYRHLLRHLLVHLKPLAPDDIKTFIFDQLDQCGLARTVFTDDALADNVRTFVDAIVKAKPSGAKGTYLKDASLSSTMGPGLKFNVSSATA